MIIVGAAFLGALVLGLSVTPAMAAEKVLDIKERGITMTFFDAEAGVCGAIALTVHVTFRQLTVTAWSDGHAKFSFSAELLAFDASGTHRVRDYITVTDSVGPGGLPLTSHFKGGGVCTPESRSPGFEWHATFGFTINENGELTSVRMLEIGNPPGPG